MGALNSLLNRLPIMLGAILYALFLGYQTWDWLNSDASELGQKKAEAKAIVKALESTKVKIKDAEEFYKNLDLIKAEIRQLSSQLENSKNSLTGELDVGDFISIVTHEAKKLGLVVKSIAPEPVTQKEFYLEVPFRISLSGAYVQMLVFFDRISTLTQIVRVSDVDMKTAGNNSVKYVPLTGSAKLVAYRYIGTKADDVSNRGATQ